jgi:anti-anti-sigma factor
VVAEIRYINVVIPGRSEELNIEMADSARGARIFKLIGPLTLRTLFEFQESARKETDKAVIIDIADVPYMDSAGLGVVISIFASCQRTNRGFAITGISPRIRTLFEVTHCDGLLPCFDSVDAADAVIPNS